MLLILLLVDVIVGLQISRVLPWWAAVIISIVLLIIMVGVYADRSDRKEYEAMIAEAPSHSDNCECNGCAALERGAWGPGGFLHSS